MRRAVYLWTGYWSWDQRYLAMEPADLENVPFATCLTLLGVLGLFLAWREKPFEVIRYAGVLFLFPVMYYFTHPEPYDMRAIDPLLAILGCAALVTLHERVRVSAPIATAAPESGALAGSMEY
jgi:hypothetical protein